MGQELPKVFEERMKDMLGDEFAAYLASYENVRQYGLRINPLKISGKELEETGYFHLQQIPWVRDGFFIRRRISRRAILFMRQVYIIFRNPAP